MNNHETALDHGLNPDLSQETSLIHPRRTLDAAEVLCAASNGNGSSDQAASIINWINSETPDAAACLFDDGDSEMTAGEMLDQLARLGISTDRARFNALSV